MAMNDPLAITGDEPLAPVTAEPPKPPPAPVLPSVAVGSDGGPVRVALGGLDITGCVETVTAVCVDGQAPRVHMVLREGAAATVELAAGGATITEGSPLVMVLEWLASVDREKLSAQVAEMSAGLAESPVSVTIDALQALAKGSLK